MPSIINPGLGLYLGQAPLATPERALQDGLNFRIKQGKMTNRNLGWTRFSENWALNGPVVLIDNFFPRGATEHLLFASPTDIYRYNSVLDEVVFLTPRVENGTASASGTTVTGTGTTWQTDGVKPGDEIHFGTAGQTDPTVTWFIIATVDSETQLTLTEDAGVIADGPYTIRRLFTGQVDNLWSFDTFVNDGATGDDLWLATNGVDDVVSWDGAADQVTLHPELGFVAQVITVYFNMAIYGNVAVGGDDFPTSIINSDPGFPLNAGSTGGPLSGQFQVHDGTDGIENLIPLGENLVIYSSRHVTLSQFVGNEDLVFIFRQAIEGIGALGHNAIADFGDFHTFISADGQYEFDGVTVNETSSHVWRDVIRQTDPLRRFRIYGHFDEENGDLIWSVPLTTDDGSGTVDAPPEFAFPEHYLEDVPPGFDPPYSKRFFPFLVTGYFERAEGLRWQDLTQEWQETNFSWNDQFFAAAFPQNLGGDENGIIWLLNENQTAGGTLLNSFVRFGRVALGTGRERGLLARVYPFAELASSGDLIVRVRISDHAAGPSDLAAEILFDQDLIEGGHFVSPFVAGRYMELEFGSSGNVWTLQGYDIDVRQGGMR